MLETEAVVVGTLTVAEIEAVVVDMSIVADVAAAETGEEAGAEAGEDFPIVVVIVVAEEEADLTEAEAVEDSAEELVVEESQRAFTSKFGPHWLAVGPCWNATSSQRLQRPNHVLGRVSQSRHRIPTSRSLRMRSSETPSIMPLTHSRSRTASLAAKPMEQKASPWFFGQITSASP